MKLLICVDMEGISGVTSWDQVDPDKAEYQRTRHQMTADVNAAIRGARTAGAGAIQISDGHDLSGNLLVEELDQDVQLNSGLESPLAMVEGAQTGVDAAFFIGYHARAGTQNATLDHTWSTIVHNVWLNGQLVGEIGLNAAMCGQYGVPVLLVTGDEAAGIEARDWIPGVDAVVVKVANSRYSAQLLSPATAQEKICEAAATAVLRFKKDEHPQPLKVRAPVEVRIEFNQTNMADLAEYLPGSVRADARTIAITAPDMAAAYRAFDAAVMLARK